MKHIDATPKEIRKFGLTFMVLCLLLAALSLYKGTTFWHWCLGAGAVFLVTGLFAQPLLKPLYIGWMTLAFALGWINTRIILGIVFYLIFTPVGLMMRLFQKDSMGLRFDKQAASYWIKRGPPDAGKERHERIF